MSRRFAVLALTGIAVMAGSAGCSVVARGPQVQRTPFVRPLPDTNEYARLLSKDDAVKMRSGMMTLAPGANCGAHSTDNYEELIICLAGAGEIETEGVGRRPISAGQYAYNPPHTRHDVFNTGTERLRYIYVVAPAEEAQHPPHE
jgi:mannose-6-phosphate isomerase-like protein (cupin superfamily)